MLIKIVDLFDTSGVTPHCDARTLRRLAVLRNVKEQRIAENAQRKEITSKLHLVQQQAKRRNLFGTPRFDTSKYVADLIALEEEILKSDKYTGEVKRDFAVTVLSTLLERSPGHRDLAVRKLYDMATGFSHGAAIIALAANAEKIGEGIVIKALRNSVWRQSGLSNSEKTISVRQRVLLAQHIAALPSFRLQRGTFLWSAIHVLVGQLIPSEAHGAQEARLLHKKFLQATEQAESAASFVAVAATAAIVLYGLSSLPASPPTPTTAIRPYDSCTGLNGLGYYDNKMGDAAAFFGCSKW